MKANRARPTSERRGGWGFARFVRDDSGVAAIEMAFVMMFAIFIVIGTFELAFDMIVDATVQIAAQQASRAGLTTATPANGNTRAQQAKDTINAILKPWTNIGGVVTINTVNYGTYNNIGTTNSQANMGSFGDVVSYNITLKMNALTGINKLMGLGAFTYSRNYIVQNEK